MIKPVQIYKVAARLIILAAVLVVGSGFAFFQSKYGNDRAEQLFIRLPDTAVELLNVDVGLVDSFKSYKRLPAYQKQITFNGLALGSSQTEEQDRPIKSAQSGNDNTMLVRTLVVAFLAVSAFLIFFIIRFNIQRKYFKQKLIEATENAEKTARIKEGFMANMSHEIRTPMNVIIGFTEQLLKPGKNINTQMYLNGIKRSAEHLLRLINDILDFSKIESGKLGIENIGFRWKEIIDDVYMLLRGKAEEKNLDFGYTLKENIPDILIGDPVRLKQILINMVDNAIKFTNHGQVQIICELVQDNGVLVDLKFTVTDTGIGINKNKIKDIFEEFSQADPGTARKFGGSGLGLSICKKLVELHGGQIYVSSIEGKGSEFVFMLPYKKGTEADINVEVSVQGVAVGSLKGKSILVVDDEEFNRKLAKVILEQYEVRVEEAENGTIALEKIMQLRLDAVLLDIQMPGLSGIEVIKHIRQLKNLPEKANIPVVALTANVKGTDQELYLSEGMSDCLTKPFKEIELLQKLAKVLNLKNKSDSDNSMVNKGGKSQEGEGSGRLFNLDELKKITRGDEVFFKKIIKLFIESTPVSANEMLEAMQNGEWEKVGMIAHKMRPSFAHMGMKGLAQDLREIEDNAGEHRNLDQTKELVEGFCTKSQIVMGQLKELI